MDTVLYIFHIISFLATLVLLAYIGEEVDLDIFDLSAFDFIVILLIIINLISRGSRL